jgi:hypothetical protein
MPTIGTPTQAGNSVLVNFTPATIGGRAAIYRAVSNPGGVEAISYGSSPVVIESGLASGTAYTFTVRGETSSGATNGYSAASSSITPNFGAYELISSTILTSTASSVTFSSIPSTYKHLQLRCTVRGINGATFPELRIQLNGDTASNYSYHDLRGTGSAVASSSSSSVAYMRMGSASKTATTSSFYAMVCDILDYGNTSKNKTLRALGGHTSDGYDDIRLASGSWGSTSAVSSINLFPAANDFAVGSRFSLYGVKG